jgi:DNA-binding MarR family transcriptional regulator
VAVTEALSGEEEAMWRAFVEVLTRLPRALDEQFNRETGLTMTEYSVLVALSEAADRELRISELADVTALSRSRISRVVDDMGRRLLVTRRKCQTDARSSFAVLTDDGLRALESAYPGHLARVRRLVLDHLTKSEVRTFTHAFGRVAEVLRGDLPGD